MTTSQSQPGKFIARGAAHEIEHSYRFMPKFDDHGLIPAIVTDATTGAILMFAWMNAEALELTMVTRVAHFYSRSRSKLWKKGEESGNVMNVVAMATDCDQDSIAIAVQVSGNGVACHTGAVSCFYRTVDLDAPPSGLAYARDAAQVPLQPVVK